MTKSLVFALSLCLSRLAICVQAPTVSFSIWGRSVVGLPLLVHYEIVNPGDSTIWVDLGEDQMGWLRYRLDGGRAEIGGQKAPPIGDGIIIDVVTFPTVNCVKGHGKVDGLVEVMPAAADGIGAGPHALKFAGHLSYREYSEGRTPWHLTQEDSAVDFESLLDLVTSVPTPASYRDLAGRLVNRLLEFNQPAEWLLLKELFAIPSSAAYSSWRQVLLTNRIGEDCRYFGAKFLSSKDDAQSRQLLKDTAAMAEAKHEVIFPHYAALLKQHPDAPPAP